jgi:hypothetical protein
MPPAVRGSAVGVVRMMMLIFRNAAEAEPRTKVWLDGATICRMGQEAVLVSRRTAETARMEAEQGPCLPASTCG